MVNREELVNGETYIYYDARDIHIFRASVARNLDYYAGIVKYRILGSSTYTTFIIHDMDLEKIVKIENVRLERSQQYYIQILFDRKEF